MEEGPSAAGDHVERAPIGPLGPSLVVVDVAGEIEEPVALKAQLAGGEHPRAHVVLLAERDRRVGRDEPDSRVATDRAAALLEVPPLPEVEPAELPVGAPEIEPRC